MKNRILLSLIFASSLIAFSGCDKNEDSGEVKPQVEPKFVLDHDSLTLNLDDDYVLGYTLENLEGTIRWSSSNSSILGVSNNKLIAKNEGTATVTAEIGGIKRTCEVSVVATENGQYFIDSSKAINIEKNSEGIVPEFHYYVIKDGKKIEINNETPSYEVKDEAIAKIVDGRIVPVSVGQTTLKVDYMKASSEFILNVCTQIISKETQFFNMVANKEAGSFFALANDLDLTGKAYDAYSTSNDLTSYASCFKGTFEGNGYTIKGINITGKSKNHSIFGLLYNAHIKDVNFEDVTLDNRGADSMAILANGITGDDCEIKNVKISCNLKGNTTGNLNLITSKYLERSFTLIKSETERNQISCGASKLTNIVIDAKFDGRTMKEANYNIFPEDSYGFMPECNNVFVYAQGGYATTLPGVKVFENKLDLIWHIHNEKSLPDSNWDYSEPFKIPSLLNASSSSGFVYSQGEKAEIDPQYEQITVRNQGVDSLVFPYGDKIEGYVYGDHPVDKSTHAVFVNQRLVSYAMNLSVPAADIDLNNYLKVCFFVRTKTFNKSWITIKDLNTKRDYDTRYYNSEISSKWVKVEMVKKSEGLWNVFIGKDKINFDYPANYFNEIPLRFNDTKYYYSEMLGIKDPNVVPKTWNSTGVVATKTNGDALATTTDVTCTLMESEMSTIVEASDGMADIAKFVAQDTTKSSEFKFYVKAAQVNPSAYFILSVNGSSTIDNIPGLVSHSASSTDWLCYKFVIASGKIQVYRDVELKTTIDGTDFTKFGIQASGKFYVSEMFCYK